MSTLDEWSIRIKAAQDASSRSRYAYLATIIVSIAFGIITFNSYLSWEKSSAKYPISRIASCTYSVPGHFLTAECEVIQEKLKEIEKEYIQNQTLKNNLLGITVNSNDAPILGSISIAIFVTWFYLCMKKENRIIFKLLHDVVQKNDPSLYGSVYHGIISYLVFNNVAVDDFPIINLKGDQRVGEYVILRIIYRSILFLPSAAILFIFIGGIYSLSIPSPVRDPNQALFHVLSSFEKTEALTGLFISFACGLIVTISIKIMLGFDEGTRNMLNEFYSLLPKASGAPSTTEA